MSDEAVLHVRSQSGQSWTFTPGTTVVAGRNRNADIILMDPECSRRQFEIAIRPNTTEIRPLSETVPTYCNDQPVMSIESLRTGSVIRAGQTRLEITLISNMPSQADALENGPAVMTQPVPIGPFGDGPQLALPNMHLTGDARIGREPECQVCLPHVLVSRNHARVEYTDGQPFLRDLKSTNGTFVDGKRVRRPVPLRPGSQIGIGPYRFSWNDKQLVETARPDERLIEARGLTRHVPGNRGGRMKVVLDDVSLVIRPHEFVCLLGPTGSGKSTLLSALNARSPADTGHVLINGSDLYEEFESLRQDMAVVPQHDILHDALTLDQALTYTAQLRLPADTSAPEIRQRIAELCVQTGLADARRTLLGKLSGGQRRRASLASELLADPGLLFLDEVTSGLDEATDRQMMHLFRTLADSGKTVVCVTHTLASVQDMCHLVVLLTVGGKLAFVGTPREALNYFQVDRLGLIYASLADPDKADDLQKRFKASPNYERYVTSRFISSEVQSGTASDVQIPQLFRRWLTKVRTQYPVLLSRYFRVLFASRKSTVGLLMQVLIVALVLWLVFGTLAAPVPGTGTHEQMARFTSECCHLVFVLGVSCFWFGCNNSAREIVKERLIYQRELMAGLCPASYYLSKSTLQLVVAACQSILLLCLVDQWCSLPGDTLAQASALACAAATGVAAGLLLSCVSTTQEAALTLVPLILIPQIILSGVFMPLEGIASWLGNCLVSNYHVYGMLRGTFTHDIDRALQNHPSISPPLERASGLLATFTQILIPAGLSTGILHFRDCIMACSRKSFRQAVRTHWLVRRWISRDETE